MPAVMDKAATLTRDGEQTYFSFPIAKAETDADGNVIVYGKASDGSLDSDSQIIDSDFAAKAIREWLDDGANIRVQHNPQRDPAGVGISMDSDGDGGTWVKSKIIEPVAQKLVLGGALRAYSVGIARPTIVRDASARGGRITDGQVVEISLVDRPANKNCSIQLVKAAKDGHAELSGDIEGYSDFIQKALSPEVTKVGGPHGYVHGWIKVGPGEGGSLEHRGFSDKDVRDIGRQQASHAAEAQRGMTAAAGTPEHASELRGLAAESDKVQSDNFMALHSHAGGSTFGDMQRGGGESDDKIPESDTSRTLRRAADMIDRGQPSLARQHARALKDQAQKESRVRPEYAARLSGAADKLRTLPMGQGMSASPPSTPDFERRTAQAREYAKQTEKGAMPAEKMITLELPEDVTVAFSPADLQRVIAKRKSPNVGEDSVSGGVDRDSMPAGDFAGRNRSFPIHSPGDVSDAASSVGRAGDGNYSSDQLKSNIKRIAHRKGPEYVAQLPDSWKSDDDSAPGSTGKKKHQNDDFLDNDTVDENADSVKQATYEYLLKFGWLETQLDALSAEALTDLEAATKSAEAEVEKGAQCTLCHGTGKIREGHVTCPRCHGDGSASSGSDDSGSDDSGNDGVGDDSVEKSRRSRSGSGDSSDSGDGSGDDSSDDDAKSSGDDGDGDWAGDDGDDDGKASKSLTAAVTKSCGLCSGSGKLKNGTVRCPRCVGTGARLTKSERREVLSKDWKQWDQAHESGSGGGSGGAGSSQADASSAYNQAHQSMQAQQHGGKVTAAEAENEHEVHEAHEEHEAHEAALRARSSGSSGSHGSSGSSGGSGGGQSGAKIVSEHNENFGAAAKADDTGVVIKGKGTCAKCGSMMKAKHRFCPSCGAPSGGSEPEKTGARKMVEKSAVPGDTVSAANDAHRIPPHREPDGAEVEAFERDSGLSDGDHEAPTPLELPTLKGDASALSMLRLVRSGAPVPLGVLHDLTCPSFHPATVAKCYPERSLATDVNVGDWQVKSLELAATLPYQAAAKAAALGHHATALKSATAQAAWEAHEELHKAFSDANPGPGTAPTPATVTPGKFNRPYLSGGHAAASPAYGSPNTTPITSGTVAASQFTRGPLTAGHEAPSPANEPGLSASLSAALSAAVDANNVGAAMALGGTPPTPMGSYSGSGPMSMGGLSGPVSDVSVGKSRTFYSNNSKDKTKTAMAAMHDHIAQTFPDLCPMKSEAAAEKADAAPAGVKMPAAPAQLTKAELKARKRAAKAEKLLLEEAAFAHSMLPEPDLVKAATVAEPDAAAVDLAQQLMMLQELVTSQSKMLKKQAKALDKLESQPDPGAWAYRGIPLDSPVLTKSSHSAGPGGQSMADVAERTKAMMLSELEQQFRTDPNPALREAAWRSILQLRGVG